MRQGKFLFVILSLVGVSEVLGQWTGTSATTYVNLTNPSAGVGINLATTTTVPFSKLQVIGTSTVPAAIFSSGNVGIGGLASSFSTAASVTNLLHVKDGNMWIQKGTLRVSAVNATDDGLWVSAGRAKLTGGVYAGDYGPGTGSYMEYAPSLGTFEIKTNGVAPNNYNFRIESKLNGAETSAPILGSATDLILRTNMLVGTGITNLRFFAGNSELARLASDGTFGIGTIPATTLHIKGPATTIARIEPTGWNSGVGTAKLELGDPNTYLQMVYGTGVKLITPNSLSFGAGGTEKMRIETNGNVGIGTTATEKLHIKSGNLKIEDGNIYCHNATGSFIQLGTSTVDGNYWRMSYNTATSSAGGKVVGGFGISAPNASGSWNYAFQISPSGRVDIGSWSVYTPTDATVKLAVAGTMVAQKVKVTAASNWGDFVFDKSYTLQPLAEVEQYVQANKHLPNIPSATELETSGIDTGEMLRLQMIKIEELTLHLIELKKEVVKLKINQNK